MWYNHLYCSTCKNGLSAVIRRRNSFYDCRKASSNDNHNLQYWDVAKTFLIILIPMQHLKQSLPHFVIGRIKKPNLRHEHKLIKLLKFFGQQGSRNTFQTLLCEEMKLNIWKGRPTGTLPSFFHCKLDWLRLLWTYHKLLRSRNCPITMRNRTQKAYVSQEC